MLPWLFAVLLALNLALFWWGRQHEIPIEPQLPPLPAAPYPIELLGNGPGPDLVPGATVPPPPEPARPDPAPAPAAPVEPPPEVKLLPAEALGPRAPDAPRVYFPDPDPTQPGDATLDPTQPGDAPTLDPDGATAAATDPEAEAAAKPKPIKKRKPKPPPPKRPVDLPLEFP